LALIRNFLPEKNEVSNCKGPRVLKKGAIVYWVLCLAILSFVEVGWCGPNLGQILDQAMKSRNTGTIEEVIQHFQDAYNQTTNPLQKASVLFILAEFLMDKQEFQKATEVYEDILKTGSASDKGGALYGLAQAYL